MGNTESISSAEGACFMSELSRVAEWTVPDAEIDELGHMSATQYERRALEGWRALLDAIGAGPAALAASGLTAVAVDQHGIFRREQVVGAPLSLAMGVVSAGGSRIEVCQEFANTATGDLAATFRTWVELQDLSDRAPAQLSLPWLEAALLKKAEAPARSQPRTLTSETLDANPTTADLLAAGVRPHLRVEVTPELCDAQGFMIPPRPPPAAPKYFAVDAEGKRTGQGVMNNVYGYLRGYAWPTVESRNRMVRSVRVGEVLETYAALVSVGHKVIRSATWVFEARSGALVSIAHRVNVFLSYRQRRTLDMPPEERRRLEGLATPQLLSPGAKR